MFSDDLECQKLLMEAMKYHLLPERRPMFQSPRTKPRKSTVGALYAVGGMDATKGIRHSNLLKRLRRWLCQMYKKRELAYTQLF